MSRPVYFGITAAIYGALFFVIVWGTGSSVELAALIGMGSAVLAYSFAW